MKNRYLIRAAKYFAYLIILFLVLYGILIAVGYSSWSTLVTVWSSNRIWMLVIAFVGLPLLYPFFGFVTREVRGNLETNRDVINKVLALNGYTVVSEDNGRIICRARGVKKVSLLFEDMLTITADDNYLKIEGPRKEVVRMEFRLRSFM